MTRVMALDWAQYNIRVNAIGPGPIRTPFTTEAVDQGAMPVSAEKVTLGRFGEPDEIVGAALYLASEASSFVTGAFLLVDGGQSIKWNQLSTCVDVEVSTAPFAIGACYV